MKFTKEFTDAVEQKNRLRVRIMLKDAFLLDKTGDTFDKMEQYAAERMPELYEAHDEEIKNGEPRISGLTWHHTEHPGQMQLIDSDVHSKCRHTGGRSVWGGGSECR